MQNSKVSIINKLQSSGLIQELYNLGIVNMKTIIYANVYNHYDAMLKISDEETPKARHSQAIKKTAKKFNCDVSSVYKILKEMETNVNIARLSNTLNDIDLL